jgi:triosephosphate isomerase
MKALIIGNWKMYPATFKEAKELFAATRKAADVAKDVTLVVAPPALFLRELAGSYKGTRIAFASQSAHWDKVGAHTGEVSVTQVADAGACYVIVGHSERRAGGETLEDTQKKVPAVLAAKMLPVLCVGELKRSDSGAHLDYIKDELRAGFAGVPQNKISKVIVAYEPVWAIGGEKAMEPREMHEMAIFIRKSIVEMYGQGGMSVKIIYGGAVNETNAVPMLKDGDVVGLLPGHVSVDAERFTLLLKTIQKGI